MPDNSTENEIVIATCYFISGIMGVIEVWLQDINLITPEKMVEISYKLIENGIHAFHIKK
jgi:hypothetical protein